MSTGDDSTQLNSTLVLMDVPGMQKRMYTDTEEFLGKEMQTHLTQSMQEGAEEKIRHTIATNSFHQGIPSITVVVNGGWSKQSHKHSYNAKSGVAVIFGSHTRKLLFMGIRNKFCAVCAVTTNKRMDVPQHKCYCNWFGTSAAMDSDIIAEGFPMSEQMYGLRYMSVIADGDSSVMATIWETVLYGILVKKIECANHACKAYRSRLEALAKDNPEYRGKGGLTKKVIQRLTVGTIIAITKHSVTKNSTQLRYDLRNGPSQVFGDHTNCTFQQNPSIPDNESDEEEQISTIIQTETELQISPHDEHDAAQGGHTSLISNPAPGLFNAVAKCTDRIVSLASQLVSNQTSNLA